MKVHCFRAGFPAGKSCRTIKNKPIRFGIIGTGTVVARQEWNYNNIEVCYDRGEFMIQWTAELARRMACSREERLTLIPLVRTFIEMSASFQEGGLPALSPQVAAIGEPLARIGLDLYSEGIVGEAFQDIMSTYLSTSPESGFPFFKQCILIESLIGITELEPPALLLRRLVAYFGAEDALELLESTISTPEWSRDRT